MKKTHGVMILVILVCIIARPAAAGDTKVKGDAVIARVLEGLYDEFTFEGEMGQILFAEAKSEVYQDRGRKGGDHGSTGGGCTDGGTTGGCSDESSTGGCSDDGSGGGPGDLCLQVLLAGEKICWAGRPMRPGWQRDPRLACPLPWDGVYTLRVFIGQCGSTETHTYKDADILDAARFYHLSLSLMEQTPAGPIAWGKKNK